MVLLVHTKEVLLLVLLEHRALSNCTTRLTLFRHSLMTSGVKAFPGLQEALQQDQEHLLL